jgi:hypothetical protein
LVLSHNRISGTVPKAMQQTPFVVLDLSYNKITGSFDEHDTNFNQAELVLEVNRLSGDLMSSALRLVSSLEVLQGNMFGCGHTPSNDEYYKENSCGSSQLEDAVYLWMILAGSVTVYLALAAKAKLGGKRCWGVEGESSGDSCMSSSAEASSLSGLNQVMRNSLFFIAYPKSLLLLSSGDEFAVYRIVEFCKGLNSTLQVGVSLSLMSLVLFVPFYILKLLDWGEEVTAYTTHTNTYGYTASMAYISGEAPAVLLLLGWSVLLLLVAALYFWLKHPPNNASATRLSSGPELCDDVVFIGESGDVASCSKHSPFRVASVLLGVLGANSVIVGTVNGLYLYSIYSDLANVYRVFIQLLR